jgi:hypothetical protein
MILEVTDMRRVGTREVVAVVEGDERGYRVSCTQHIGTGRRDYPVVLAWWKPNSSIVRYEALPESEATKVAEFALENDDITEALRSMRWNALLVPSDQIPDEIDELLSFVGRLCGTDWRTT